MSRAFSVIGTDKSEHIESVIWRHNYDVTA